MVATLAAVVAGVALVLVAAKAHGRQVRLERELAGFGEADFSGPNPPEVEAIWARDRRLFWASFAVLALAALPIAFVALAPDLWMRLLLGGIAAFAGGFALAGLASLARFRSAPADAAKGPWRATSLRGSAGWFAAEGAAWVAFAASCAWP
jgi:hypothetical protein